MGQTVNKKDSPVERVVRLRFDVDYAFPSRNKSFLYTLLNVNGHESSDYLKNAKIIAQMINESPRKVTAIWFFTPQTTPDKELLNLLTSNKHEIGLHIAKEPYAELERLQKATDQQITHYTIHGTSRIFARIMWRRKLSEKVITVPEDFPIKTFHGVPTLGLDVYCFDHSVAEGIAIANSVIATTDDGFLHLHPEWLFQSGNLNHRGRYYEVLKSILGVDSELNTLAVQKKWFFKIAKNTKEYEENPVFSEYFLKKLADRGIDVFSFFERAWCCPIQNPPPNWVKTEDNIALLGVTSFKEWWEKIGKKTRNMVRKAEKSGVRIDVTQPSLKFAEGVWKIHNETPIRQERAYPHFGISKQTVEGLVMNSQNSVFIGAYIKEPSQSEEELVGFIQLIFGDNIVIVAQILSLQKHWDKALNNALLAKAVETVAAKGAKWLMYGRIGNHPSLDKFKENNGFVKYPLKAYFVPLTRKGRLAIRLGLHRDTKDALPQFIKDPLIPVFNWVSRTKVKLRNRKLQ